PRGHLSSAGELSRCHDSVGFADQWQVDGVVEVEHVRNSEGGQQPLDEWIAEGRGSFVDECYVIIPRRKQIPDSRPCAMKERTDLEGVAAGPIHPRRYVGGEKA